MVQKQPLKATSLLIDHTLYDQTSTQKALIDMTCMKGAHGHVFILYPQSYHLHAAVSLLSCKAAVCQIIFT